MAGLRSGNSALILIFLQSLVDVQFLSESLYTLCRGFLEVLLDLAILNDLVDFLVKCIADFDLLESLSLKL